MSKSCTPSQRLPRMWLWSIISIGLLMALYFIRPEQLQVVLYKAALVTIAATLAYWIDRSLFPYAQARPHQCISFMQIVGAWIRRAIIVLACVLGMTLGL